jgi:hypothetical protein
VPEGKRLTVSVDGDELRLDLVDAPPGTVRELIPVPVPTRVAKYHSVAHAFRDDDCRHEVARTSLGRAVRLVHALATEAERRGYTVATVSDSRDSYANRPLWRGAEDGHFAITVNDYTAAIRIREKGMPNGTYYRRLDPTADVLRQRSRRRAHDEANASGTLICQIVTSAQSNRQASWSDRTDTPVETHLPALLREIEVRAAEDAHRRARAAEEAAKRHLAWEQAMERAQVAWLEAFRASVLRTQVADWEAAISIRAFAAAVASEHGRDADAREWTAWALGYADSIDPLNTSLSIPPAPDTINPEELRPYLGRWSPHGPDRHR